MRYFLLFSLSPSLLFTQEINSALSLQSYSGLINTPNAQVLEEKLGTISFNNQFNNHLRDYNYNLPKTSEENYLLGIGFLPNLEVVTQLTEVEAFTTQREESVGFEVRDLSFSFKYQLPFHQEYLPNIAIGSQDLGGESNYFSNNYIVLDKKIGFMRTSLGYGKSSDTKVAQRMNGLFGGIEATLTPWSTLLADYDTKESHVALRLSTPKTWLNGVQLQTMISQNITESATSLALTLSIPLEEQQTSKHLAQVERSSSLSYPINKPKIALKNTQKTIPHNSSRLSNQKLLKLQKKLAEIGFENIRIGRYGEKLYIECENGIFERNDLDALGVILGTSSQYLDPNTDYILTLLKNNLQQLTIQGTLSSFKNYLNQPNQHNKLALQSNLKFSREFDTTNVTFIGSKVNSSFFKPNLELSLGVISTVGTEIGLFDYALSLRTHAYTTLYDGLTLSTCYDTPLTHSHNFDDDQVYGKIYHDQLQSRWVNLMLNQTLHHDTLLNTFSVGKYQEHYLGFLNHTNLTTTSGEHGFNLRIGSFENQDISEDTRDIYLGSYRYYYAPLDLFGEVTYGQFWNQDQGGMLQLKRFFGDTSIALYLKDTTQTYAGFELSLPLTWEKTPNTQWGKLHGKKDFSYGIRTVVNDQNNNLQPAGAIIPKNDLELETEYLNRDRLNAQYIRTHLDRLSQAYKQEVISK